MVGMRVYLCILKMIMR